MHCFQFLSVLTIVQEEIENSASMLSWDDVKLAESLFF